MYQIYVMREGNCCGASYGYLLPEKFSVKRKAIQAMNQYKKQNPLHIVWLSNEA